MLVKQCLSWRPLKRTSMFDNQNSKCLSNNGSTFGRAYSLEKILMFPIFLKLLHHYFTGSLVFWYIVPCQWSIFKISLYHFHKAVAPFGTRQNVGATLSSKEVLVILKTRENWNFAIYTARWFQVMGIPRWGGHCLTVIYSNIVPLNIKLFTKYLRRHPTKHIRTKKPPEKLSRCLQEP